MRPLFALAMRAQIDPKGRRNGGLFIGKLVGPQSRHCEKRSDEAIQTASAAKVWIASLALAMTPNTGDAPPFCLSDAGADRSKRPPKWRPFHWKIGRAPVPSLREAKRRSNPDCIRGESLDCFA